MFTMLRSKSVDHLPSFGTTREDGVWTEEDTKLAMLDIILNEGTEPLISQRDSHYDATRGRRRREEEKMWTMMMEPNPVPTIDRAFKKIGQAKQSKQQQSSTNSNISDVDAKKEKEYIAMSNLPSYQRGPFKSMIMQTFFKSANPQNNEKPRPFTRSDLASRKSANSAKLRLPSFISIGSHRRLCTPEPCPMHAGHSGQYCDILGAGACGRCIENSNRHIADVIQNKLFPDIKVTSRCLIGPKLSRALNAGHGKELRRMKIKELHLPANFFRPARYSEKNSECLETSSKASTCDSLPSLSVSLQNTFSVKSSVSLI